MNILYNSFEELARLAGEQGTAISDVVLADQAAQMEEPPEALLARMDADLTVMQEAAEKGLDPALRSASGLSGGSAARVDQYVERTGGICGPRFGRSLAVALAVSECNAAMGRIVATPTAGSCGILPGAVLPLLEEGRFSREQVGKSLFTAGGLGMVIANKAYLAGAQGGCQAECGSASAMAAAVLTELWGGSPGQCAHAAAIALKCLLGLACDPVAGLVEVPCVKRNASGLANALCAAQLALAGVASAVPCDEVIEAMRAVGDAMPCALRETAQGGLAATPTGIQWKKRLFQ
ncbi:MAG: L-serine ammonia-lyase, iron-sulfur-dependent, subunit alpha [Clostridiales bacterium]|nr:L-serine ammonia-lyase, iron-sulfur-dependent, subunit alpha [Clostridiales bacterium]